ncbi:MAG: hypothetical protein ACLP5H_32415 [Desulfomonilaceae bacterium]
MSKKFLVIILSLAFCSLSLASQVFAFGEDMLALTGQYTFFIRPVPGWDVTFYQKLVPCVAQETVPVARRVVETYPLPIPAMHRQPITISETPVGCAQGSGPCVECYPKPSFRPASKDVATPRVVPVGVPGIELTPKCVTRPVMLPQWFAVTEEPRDIRKVSKVR